MNEKPPVRSVPGSRIRCREKDEELSLYLPARPRRALLRTGIILLPLVGTLVFFEYQDLPVLATAGIGVFVSLLAFFVFAATVGPHLTKTFVRIRPGRLVLSTVKYGREKVQEYTLSEKSHAKQHLVRARSSGSGPGGGHSWLHGIDVTARQGTAHFGDGLSPGELDWVEWRINRFLGHATDAEAPAAATATRWAGVAPIEGVPDKPVAPPKDTKIRIDEDLFQTRIHFPNTVETRTLSGIGSAVFGLGWSAFCIFGMLQAWGRRHATVALISCGVTALFGLLFLLSGLTRLFGRRRLTIAPEKITYRSTFLGIGPWMTIPTADVLSVGSMERPRTRSGRVTGPAKGYVIRSASREIRYGDRLRDAVRDPAEAEWLAGEIARGIQNARSAIASGKGEPATTKLQRNAPSSHDRDRTGASVPSSATPGPIPYDIDRRPMPAGEELESLLPVRVGIFCRETLDLPDNVQNTIEARYRSTGGGRLHLSAGVCDSEEAAREAVAVAQAEVAGFEEVPGHRISLDTEPSFFKASTPRGAFLGWSRGRYFFSADAQRGEEDLDRFMQAFPY